MLPSFSSVITIIVLLILAGVSIAMLTGENGILTQANKAKEETEKASVIEQAQTDILGIQAGGNTTLTQGQLKDVLDKYFDSVPDDVNTNDILTTKEECGGKYQIAVSDIYNGGLKGDIPKGLGVGTTVNYNPNGTYDKFNENYSGSTENLVQLDSSTDAFNINTWKVFDIDYETGEVTLVPESSTNGLVYLQGAQGYNNAVYLLNEACSNLYGNSSKGIIARSINIEDIESKMTDAALTEAYSYINSDSNTKYGDKVSNPYIQNRNYPSIYAQESKSVIDGYEKNSGLERSEQTSLIEANGNEWLQAKISIQPYQTHWYGDNAFMKTAFEIAQNGENYYNLLIPDGTDTSYWLASRSINIYSPRCDFCVIRVNEGYKGNYIMINSGGGTLEDSGHGLFPIVYLNSELISGNVESGFLVE